MKSLALRSTVIFLLAAVQLLTVEPALAHTGEDASAWHTVVEFGQWALYFAGAVTAILAVFWLRARMRRE